MVEEVEVSVVVVVVTVVFGRAGVKAAVLAINTRPTASKASRGHPQLRRQVTRGVFRGVEDESRRA